MELITEIMRKNIINGKANIQREASLELMTADLYKKSILKQSSKLDGSEEYLIECFRYGNEHFFIELIEENPGLLLNLFQASYGFHKLSYLDKIRVMDRCKKHDDFEQVIEKNQILKLESIFYSFNYDNNSILYYYKNHLDTNGRTMKQHNICLNILVNYLNNIKNTPQYFKNILEALKYYYPIKKFLQVYAPDLLLEEDIILLFYIDNFSLDEIVEMAGQELRYVRTIFDEYLYLASGVNEIDPEITDFLHREVSDEIKVKLKIKEN